MPLVNQSMKWSGAISTRPSLEGAVREVVEKARQQLQSSPDLGLVFISSAFASEYPRLLPLIREQIAIPTLIGCSGGGVVGMTAEGKPSEIEDNSALSLSLACLPDVKLHSFHFSIDTLPDLDSPPEAWVDLVGVPPDIHPQFILMTDPMYAGINDLLQGLDFAYPDSVKVGGVASIGSINGSSGLFCGDRLYNEGIVGLALSGNVVLDAIVAQGCRPIGRPYRVAEGERNILLKLEGQDDSNSLGSVSETLRTPLEALQEIFQDLSEEDRLLAQNSLFIGVAQSSFKQNLGQGDFLIRNLIGIDPRIGAIAIAERVRLGQRIQFHLRDAQTSAEDLEMLLSSYQQQNNTGDSLAAAGALIFSCAGRGKGLYNEPDFDSRLFHRYLNQVPLSGFFCNGEIGPIGNTTFLHGYTSVFGICRQP